VVFVDVTACCGAEVGVVEAVDVLVRVAGYAYAGCFGPEFVCVWVGTAVARVGEFIAVGRFLRRYCQWFLFCRLLWFGALFWFRALFEVGALLRFRSFLRFGSFLGFSGGSTGSVVLGSKTYEAAIRWERPSPFWKGS